MSIELALETLNPWWRDGAVRRARGFPLRRSLHPDVLRHVTDSSTRRALLILGPRQVGKTTLLLQLADDLLDRGLPPGNLTYFDFADDRLVRQTPVREVVETIPVRAVPDRPRVLLLDEVSRAPRWDLWMKGAVDREEFRIVATDSAASVLREGGRESGQGRWNELRLDTLTFREFQALSGGNGDSLDGTVLVERYLARGGFPEHVRATDGVRARSELREDVVDRAILRDLGGRVGDPQRVRELFVYLLQSSGDAFNTARRADDLGADPRTVRSWLGHLLDTFLVVELQQWVASRKARARLRAQPKIYAADPALVTAFALDPRPMQEPPVRGRAFEAAVFRHLRELARERQGELGYFRHQERHEIDFVFSLLDGERVGVEVTSSPRAGADKLQTLRQAADRAGIRRRVLIHGGLREEMAEGTHRLPFHRFLEDPARILDGGPSEERP